MPEPDDNGILKKYKRPDSCFGNSPDQTQLRFFVQKIFLFLVGLTDPTGSGFVGPKLLYVVVVSLIRPNPIPNFGRLKIDASPQRARSRVRGLPYFKIPRKMLIPDLHPRKQKPLNSRASAKPPKTRHPPTSPRTKTPKYAKTDRPLPTHPSSEHHPPRRTSQFEDRWKLKH